MFRCFFYIKLSILETMNSWFKKISWFNFSRYFNDTFAKNSSCPQFSWNIQYRGDGLLRDDITVTSNLLIRIFDARERVYIRIKLPRKFPARRYESFSVHGALFILKFSWRRIDPRTIHRMRRYTFHVPRRILRTFIRDKRLQVVSILLTSVC